MSLYDKALKDLIEKKERRESGLFNGIPFSYPRYSNYFDGFNRGDYIGILGNTGSGKSRLMRSWMYDMIDFIMQNDYPAKILYFSLEDPEIPVTKKIMTHYLWTRHKLSITPKMLNSREVPIADKFLRALKEDEKFYRHLESIVDITNELSTPNEIHRKVAEVYKELSKDFHIIVLIDNQSNITQDDKDNSEWEAIKRLSREVIRGKFCKAGITTITVLQVDAESEKNTFRNAGKGSITVCEPNLSSIADAKVVAKSMHYVFGLFDPSRFEIKEYPYSGDYNIEIMRGKFRSLIHLKSNESEMAPRLGLLFDGLHEIFQEMPRSDDKQALEVIYQRIIAEEREKMMRYGDQKKMF